MRDRESQHNQYNGQRTLISINNCSNKTETYKHQHTSCVSQSACNRLYYTTCFYKAAACVWTDWTGPHRTGAGPDQTGPDRMLKICKKSIKYQKIIKIYPKITKNSPKYQKIQKKYQKIPKVPKRYQKIQKNIKKYPKNIK